MHEMWREVSELESGELTGFIGTLRPSYEGKASSPERKERRSFLLDLSGGKGFVPTSWL